MIKDEKYKYDEYGNLWILNGKNYEKTDYFKVRSNFWRGKITLVNINEYKKNNENNEKNSIGYYKILEKYGKYVFILNKVSKYYTLLNAVANNEYEYVKIAIKNGSPWDSVTYSIAAFNGNLQILKYLNSKRHLNIYPGNPDNNKCCRWKKFNRDFFSRHELEFQVIKDGDNKSIEYALLNDHFDCFKFLAMEGYNYDTNIIDKLIKNKSVDFKMIIKILRCHKYYKMYDNITYLKHFSDTNKKTKSLCEYIFIKNKPNNYFNILCQDIKNIILVLIYHDIIKSAEESHETCKTPEIFKPIKCDYIFNY